MCVEFLAGDKWISSLAEVRAWLGTEPAYEDAGGWYGPQTPGHYCLCGIDLDKTAAMAGGKIEWGDDAYMVFTAGTAGGE